MPMRKSHVGTFDPFNLSSKENWKVEDAEHRLPFAAPAATALVVLATNPQGALAEEILDSPVTPKVPNLDPQSFQPVCPASDGFYRFLQGTTEAVVGTENFSDYGPLIAGGLLRIRLELCVIESFFNEAVGPFIQQNGLTWILPLHETVETFLAGTIFSLASTFILVGSSKLVAVIVTYADVFVGLPFRLLGGFAFDRARGKPITLDIGFGPFKTRVIGPPEQNKEPGTEEAKEQLIDFDKVSPFDSVIIVISGVMKFVGEVLKVSCECVKPKIFELPLMFALQFSREFIEALDLFVGRYLVLIATGYIGLKFLHFKVFPDFPF